MTNKNSNQNKKSLDENEQLSTLELIWEHANQEIDSWAQRSEYYDQEFLKAAKKYVDSVNQNREKMKLITDQFNKELQEWEATAREELLMTTTTLQQIFPKKSYHEINQVMDNIQNKMTTLLMTPINVLASAKTFDKYLEAVEQYVSLRKQSRQQYIESVKQTASVFYKNQKMFMNLFENQLKTAVFPFQKYMKEHVN